MFTSYSNLYAVQNHLSGKCPYPLLTQGSAPRTALLREFRNTPNAVLLATSSFWQGVDVVGEALSCVVIDKLPFASPGDPIIAARMEAIEAQGGNAFSDYQLPLAILTLLQGFGRLIRHRHDRGILALLDPRIKTKTYGRRFLASLPRSPITHDLETVKAVFNSDDIQFETITPCYDVVTPSPMTSTKASIRTVTGTSVSGNEVSFQDQGFQPVQLNTPNDLTTPRIVCSQINETTY